ncbi:hypothetical protein H5410_057610 [Solanum commersonii]|uniref:Uncharacterized protein n=1 Tax=Solanum commersonii TaxID=4109 RepID=A0A9J5WQN8_SOLCO|nr:hypothetical protein H5410_057610 [Solanum commersonii]
MLINYCDMPLFFGKREFVIIIGLKYHSPSEPILVFTSTEEHNLVSLVGPSFKNPPDLFNPPHDAVSCYITNLKLSYVSYVATDESSVAVDAPYVANDASYVATFDQSVTTCDPNVAIDDSYGATDDASVATCDTNVATDVHMLHTSPICSNIWPHMLQHLTQIFLHTTHFYNIPKDVIIKLVI